MYEYLLRSSKIADFTWNAYFTDRALEKAHMVWTTFIKTSKNINYLNYLIFMWQQFWIWISYQQLHFLHLYNYAILYDFAFDMRLYKFQTLPTRLESCCTHVVPTEQSGKETQHFFKYNYLHFGFKHGTNKYLLRTTSSMVLSNISEYISILWACEPQISVLWADKNTS